MKRKRHKNTISRTKNQDYSADEIFCVHKKARRFRRADCKNSIIGVIQSKFEVECGEEAKLKSNSCVSGFYFRVSCFWFLTFPSNSPLTHSKLTTLNPSPQGLIQQILVQNLPPETQRFEYTEGGTRKAPIRLRADVQDKVRAFPVGGFQECANLFRALPFCRTDLPSPGSVHHRVAGLKGILPLDLMRNKTGQATQSPKSSTRAGISESKLNVEMGFKAEKLRTQ